jgi:AcrR family transcriptional regulator
MQRARLIDAMVQVVCERGYARTSVSSVCARAKVSRSTFPELFDGLEDCFLTVMEDAYRHVRMLISQAFEREKSWLDGVRGALAALLSFFDSEPVRAHVLLVEVTAAGPRARERREQHIVSLTMLIEARWGPPENGHPHSLVTAGVMASLLGVLHTHLVTGRKEPVIGLLGSLMGLVTAPYLDRRGVAREVKRGEDIARKLLERDTHEEQSGTAAGGVEIPDLLLDPRAHRARACILHLAEHPGASNRQVARAVGIARDTHISTLLARLHREGLVVKRPCRPGGPNAWTPSPYGLQIAYALRLARPIGKDTSGTMAGHA